MQESLRVLSQPRTDVASLLAGVITDIRRTCVNFEMPAWQKVDAIMGLLDEVCPPPPPGAWAGFIPPGAQPAQVAAMLADHLAGHPAMVTELARAWTTENIAVITQDKGERPATAEQARRLRLRAGHPVYWRDGWLVTDSSVIIARVQVAAVEARLPEAVRAGLGGYTPFGALVGQHQPHRQARIATATGGDPAIDSTAAVHLGADPVPCALAWEQFTADFCRHLARLAATLARQAPVLPARRAALTAAP